MQYFRNYGLIEPLKPTSFSQSIFKTLLIILVLFAFSQASLAKDEKSVVSQLKLCWQFSDFESTAIRPIVQNDHLVVSATGGKIFALNLPDGATLWRTELGGEIIGQTLVNNNLIFTASQVAATADKPALVVLRALSLITGLTVWQGELPAASSVKLALHHNFLLAAINEIGAAGKVFGLAADSGELIWTRQQTAEITTFLLVKNNSLVFATADQRIQTLKTADGRTLGQFKLPHGARGQIVATDNGTWLFGDPPGNVSAIRESNGKRLWTARLGGAVQDILLARHGVILSSLDDFVYYHNQSNGKRIWRKRLASRPLGAAAVSDETILLAATGENTVTVLSLNKGKNLSQLFLGDETVAVAAPIAARNFVLIPTNQGLLSFAPSSNVCPAKETGAAFSPRKRRARFSIQSLELI